MQMRGWAVSVGVGADGSGWAPDEADQLVVEHGLPVVLGGAGGFGAGVDVEAAEQAVDAVFAEAALAEDADLFVENGVGLGWDWGWDRDWRSIIGVRSPGSFL